MHIIHKFDAQFFANEFYVQMISKSYSQLSQLECESFIIE